MIGQNRKKNVKKNWFFKISYDVMLKCTSDHIKKCKYTHEMIEMIFNFYRF